MRTSFVTTELATLSLRSLFFFFFFFLAFFLSFSSRLLFSPSFFSFFSFSFFFFRTFSHVAPSLFSSSSHLLSLLFFLFFFFFLSLSFSSLSFFFFSLSGLSRTQSYLLLLLFSFLQISFFFFLLSSLISSFLFFFSFQSATSSSFPRSAPALFSRLLSLFLSSSFFFFSLFSFFSLSFSFFFLFSSFVVFLRPALSKFSVNRLEIFKLSDISMLSSFYLCIVVSSSLSLPLSSFLLFFFFSLSFFSLFLSSLFFPSLSLFSLSFFFFISNPLGARNRPLDGCACTDSQIHCQDYTRFRPKCCCGDSTPARKRMAEKRLKNVRFRRWPGQFGRQREENGTMALSARAGSARIRSSNILKGSRQLRRRKEGRPEHDRRSGSRARHKIAKTTPCQSRMTTARSTCAAPD